MSQRLNEIIENMDKMLIGLDDVFKFHCTQCGQCCIHREDILMNPNDIYRAAKELSILPKEFVEKYCEYYLGSSSFMPVVRLKPRGLIKRCPLLNNKKCLIHNAKPTVCAMFPIGRAIRMDKEQFEKDKVFSTELINYIFVDPQCGDDSEEHTVRQWLTDFGIPMEDEFFLKWQSVVCNVGNKIKKCIENMEHDDANQLVFLIFTILYLHYDLNKDFLEQFLCNADFVEKSLNEFTAAEAEKSEKNGCHRKGA